MRVFGRGLLGAAPPAVVPAPSLEAQRAQLERVLGVTVTVLFLASVSYVTLTAMFGFLCAGGGSRSRRPADGGGTGAAPGEPAAAEDTKRALEEIPVVVVVVPVMPDPEGEEEECAVCLAEYEGGEEVRVLPACRHGFHRECVDRWLLTRAPTCPVCRAPVAARPEGRGGKACATGGAAALPAVAVAVDL